VLCVVDVSVLYIVDEFMFDVQPPQMGLSQMLYHEAMMGHPRHLPPPPTCSSVGVFVDNREKIKQWISEEGGISLCFVVIC